jgi:hypothetical protein
MKNELEGMCSTYGKFGNAYKVLVGKFKKKKVPVHAYRAVDASIKIMRH